MSAITWHSLVSLSAVLVVLLDLCVEAFLVSSPAPAPSHTKIAPEKNQAKRRATTTTPSITSSVMTCFLSPSRVCTNPAKHPQHPKSRRSKSRSRRSSTLARTSSLNNNDVLLILAQVIHSRAPSWSPLKSTASDVEDTISTVEEADLPVKRSRRSNRRKRSQKRQESKKGVNADAQSFPTTGNLPDPWYRAVSMPHLRQHPKFQALPHHVPSLETVEDVRFFRQDSWQWDALHKGRCTTSQAAAALGFLEPCAADVLGVPAAWRTREGRRAWHACYQRLKEPALRTLSEMKSALLEDYVEDSDKEEDEEWAEPSVWTVPSQDIKEPSRPLHAAIYNFTESEAEVKRRKAFLRERGGGDYLERKIRMIWGTTQEATSLLTALNYFAKHVDPGVVLEEVGMCGAGLSTDLTGVDSSLLVGASPDGVLRYSDGTIEALEVKNHCPFFSNRGRNRKAGKVKRFSIGDRLLHDQRSVFPQYVSQLQLEMLCLGETCRSAVMIRQTATQGALVLRMKRDDEWIQEMLYFLNRFQRDYVEKEESPPPNFFWTDSDRDKDRYRRFVNRTGALRNQVKLVATIPNENIQRVGEEAPFFLD